MPLITQRIAYDVDVAFEQEIRRRYQELGLPVSLTVFRMALMRAGLALEAKPLTDYVWESLRVRGRMPTEGFGTDLANAKIEPKRNPFLVVKKHAKK